MTNHTASPPADWLDSLQRLEQRNGVIELAPPGEESGEFHLVVHDENWMQASSGSSWRVRLLAIADDTLVVDLPHSAQKPIALPIGQPLEGVYIEGSTRWSFQTQVADLTRHTLNADTTLPALRLAWPTEVRNAQRRAFYRVATAGSVLPEIEMWPLDDLAPCREYERYNQLMHRNAGRPARINPPRNPVRGPAIKGRMLDLSGGGMCLGLADPAPDALASDSLVWLKIPLPQFKEPFYVAGRVARWNDQIARQVQIGIAFCFEHHPEHGRFITDQLCRFATHLQRSQIRRTR